LEFCPFCLSKIPPFSLDASDNRESQADVDYGRAMLTVWEVVQDQTGSWLRVTTNHGSPTEVWRVVALPSCGMEGASLFGVVNELEVIARCPVLQLVTVWIRFLVAPVGVMTIEVTY